jgi:hypothetical protein
MEQTDYAKQYYLTAMSVLGITNQQCWLFSSGHAAR